MIEFTIALVAVMAAMIGAMLLNRLEQAHTRAMLTARADAGELAMAPVYQRSLEEKFIADWETGGDNTRYTADDEPVLEAAAGSLAGGVAARAELDTLLSAPTNAVSQLQASPAPVNEFYLVKGSKTTAVNLSFIPAIRRLISGAPAVSVKSDAWLAWTGGIY
jgi:hypothetical protein